MATQRWTMATLAGESVVMVVALFRSWQTGHAPAEVDRFCASLRDNGLSLPLVYFCEWLDRWLMGDLLPRPDAVEGRTYQAVCLSLEQTRVCAEQCGHQFPEEEWMATRLREAAVGWDGVERRTIVVIREVLGPTVTAAEVEASRGVVPKWLSR